MFDWIARLFDTSGFPPRWHCGVWSETLGWTHIVSDAAIFGAYTAIPVVLAFFTLRRRDLPFPAVMWLFVTFIFACGATHLNEAIIFWKPIYRFAGSVKAFTAIVSWGTVFALFKIVPQVLHFPGLARLNAELQHEVEIRRRVEAELRDSEQRLERLLASEREARGEAERANRLKDEFLSTVSHELRTPLNAILGYAQLLLYSGQEEDHREGLGVIERNARMQAQIIDDLLDMSRIISGKLRLETATVNPAEVIRAALETMRPAATAKAIELAFTTDPQPAPVLGDSARLQQVVWNLLSNAVKFTPKGGRVEVSLERVNSHVEIAVKDNGQGIRPEFLPHVFDRFRQQDPGTTRRYGGLGLGLSIVKHLVELHGGVIEAHSEGDGRGATFIVRLPVRLMQGPAADGAGGAQQARDQELGPDFTLRGLRVLVVDDEPDSRELMRRFLSDFEAEVETAASVDEALAAFERRPPDLLLSDVGLPGRDGLELVRIVRQWPAERGGRVPAAAVTAFAGSEDRKRVMLAGFQAHIAKPVDPAELALVIASLSGRTGTAASGPPA